MEMPKLEMPKLNERSHRDCLSSQPLSFVTGGSRSDEASRMPKGQKYSYTSRPEAQAAANLIATIKLINTLRRCKLGQIRHKIDRSNFAIAK
jgi:hypothetical protein